MRPIPLAVLLLTTAICTVSATAQTPPPPPDMRPPGPGRMMEEDYRPSGPVKSARFRLQVGRTSLGMTCPDDETLKACADVAMQLLDKAEAMDKR